MMHERKMVLIVDDDEGTREFVQEIMRTEGWKTTAAVNGVEALDQVAEECPDLVILDVHMPEMDGFAVFQHLRSDPQTSQTPIIMLTAVNDLEPGAGYNEETMAERFGVNGPEAFVDKPVDPVYLLQAIMGVVG
ncbi:MAG: response regulator [Nitrospiraceae bacterium]|nr:response regulator [Nitrospiraceae bacterium]